MLSLTGNPMLDTMDPNQRAAIVAAIRAGNQTPAVTGTQGNAQGGSSLASSTTQPQIASASAPMSQPKPLSTVSSTPKLASIQEQPNPAAGAQSPIRSAIQSGQKEQAASRQPMPADAAKPLALPDSDQTPSTQDFAQPLPFVIDSLGRKTGPQADTSLGRARQEQERQKFSGSGISQIARRIESSDFGQNHPKIAKFLGPLAQGAATVGDIGLSLAGNPGRIAEQLIPGTEGHHALLMRNANKQVNEEGSEQEKEAQTAETRTRIPATEAQTAKTVEETREAPQKAQAEQALQNAQTEHLSAETKAMSYGKPIETSDGLLQVKPDGTAQRITVDGKPVGPPIKTEVKQIEVNGKPHQVLINSQTGDHLRDLGISGERPAQAPGVTMIVPNGQGGGTVERIGVGGTVAAGAQTASGVNTANTPTMTQRTAAGRAATVVAMAPEVLQRIDSMKDKIGPVSGRWNEVMQGKLGSDDPDFAALRSDLLMMSSAVALAHAQGRLPENLREEFDNAINAPKQSADNLKATIQTMIPWLEKMQQQGTPGAGNQVPQGASDEVYSPDGTTLIGHVVKGKYVALTK